MGKEQEYCDSKDKLPKNELPIPEGQGCCPIVEPWIGPEMGPVPEELECGPMEEQWIAIEMGCISQERGAWKVLEQSCIEEVVVEPQEEKFKYKIFRCDAMVHPNICHLEPPGPKAVLEPCSVLAVNTIGEISSKKVTLQNVGPTCLFFSWKRISQESIVAKKKKLGRHVTKCWTFSIMKVKGSLLSGETQEFNLKFTSSVPGVFMETWELIIAPKLKGDRLRISVKGFSFLDDTKSENRKRLDKILAYREMQTGYVSSVLKCIFEKIIFGGEWTPNAPLIQRVSTSRSKKQKRQPRLPCLRTLKAYHDKWIPNCKREYDISPLTSPIKSVTNSNMMYRSL